MHLTRTVTKRYMQGLKREFWYWPSMLLKCGGLGAVIGIAWSLSSWLNHRRPEISWWAFAAIACFLVGSILFYRVYLRYIARGNGAAMPAGARHVLDDKGYTIWRGAQVHVLPWQSILSIADQGGLTLVATSPVTYWPIVHAASEGEAAARFTAELQRRWQQAKGA